MGLAPYGRPIYADLILEQLIDLKPDGSFWLDMEYFNYCQGLTMTNRRFHDLFGGPPRTPESTLEQRHMDLAASIQAVTEEVVLRIGRARPPADRHEAPGPGRRRGAELRGQRPAAPRRAVRRPLDPAGGRRRRRRAGRGPVRLASAPRTSPASPTAATRSRAASSARASRTDEIDAVPRRREAPRRSGSTTRPSCSSTSPGCWPTARSSAGSRAGWSSARGPWARGASWAIPRSPAMQATMNLKIKFRESFRPFAPVRARRSTPHEWFDLEPGQESPYMLLVAPVREEHRRPDRRRGAADDAARPRPAARVNVVRSTIPAVTHVDYSARVQTVDAERNPRLHRLLEAFDRLTGCPVLVNTSFNVRGEPIVCTPEDAYRCFLATDMDALVLEDIVIVKDEAAARGRRQAAREAVPGPVPARLSRRFRSVDEVRDAVVRHPVRPADRRPSGSSPGSGSSSSAGSRLWQALVRGHADPGDRSWARLGRWRSACSAWLGPTGCGRSTSAGWSGVPDRLDGLAADARGHVLRPVHADRPGLPADRPRPAPSRRVGPASRPTGPPSRRPTDPRRYFKQF